MSFTRSRAPIRSQEQVDVAGDLCRRPECFEYCWVGEQIRFYLICIVLLKMSAMPFKVLQMLCIFAGFALGNILVPNYR